MTEKINHLLEGYLEDRLSPEELAAFLHLLEDEANREQLQDYIHTTLAANRFNGKGPASRADVLFQATMAQAAQQTQMPATAPLRRLPLVRRRLAAAAVLVLVAGSGLLFWYQSRQPKQQAVITQVQTVPILPGKDKATLTLEDGTIIQLDTAKDGTIASSGNVAVKKLNNGQLAYAFQQGSSQASVGKHTLATPRGGQFRVNLPDGSLVYLNAASSIQFPTAFDGKERHVSITGEAYFEVSKQQGLNGRLPFYVHILSTDGVEKGKVEVLGTHFNIMAYHNEKNTVTTLLEGLVKVSAPAMAGGREMTPGQASLIKNSGGGITIEEANTEQAVAWKNGYFSYNRADITTIMRQLERWYNITVEYKDVPALTFTGTIPRNVSAGQVFNILEQTNNVHFTIEGNKVIVRS